MLPVLDLPLPPPIPDRNVFTNEMQDHVLENNGSGYSTYRDKDYGFEVSFPENWRIRASKGAGEFTDGTTIAGFSFSPDSMCCDFVFAIYVTQGSLGEEEAKMVMKGWKTEQEKLQINGIDVIKIVFNLTEATAYYTYLLEKDGLVFSFTGGKMTNGESKTDVFEDIVRSFKFIE